MVPASCSGGNKVEVTAADGAKTVIEGKHILLATGSESVELPFLKFDGKHIVSSTEALSFDPVPKHLIVVGGGYIGLELGSVWKRLGAKVTVLEFLPRILSLNDGEISTAVQQILTKQGIEFHLGTKVTGATKKGDQVTVKAQGPDGKEITFTGDKVLVAVGRRPFTAGLGLDAAGVRMDAKSGRVEVDAEFRTSAAERLRHRRPHRGPHARPQGERGGHRLRGTPRGHETAHQLRRHPERHLHLARGRRGRQDGRGVEGEGDRVPRRQVPLHGERRARSLDETDGWVKVLADAKTDRVLGVHILGPRAQRAHRRVRHHPGIPRQRRGHRPMHPLPPHPERSHRRSGASRLGGNADQLVILGARPSRPRVRRIGRDARAPR